ncbi:acyl carrier protein [Rapidithrix thailandica]|uniref:Acyl carrier protein n=1 Tax=Rapidithrix thailandica TaxID=413964 RepID=A0AAW9SFX0_9BACT
MAKPEQTIKSNFYLKQELLKNMNSLPKLSEVFAEALAISSEEVTEDLSYQGIAEWDSMSHLVLVTKIEEVYQISIEMEDVLEMGSVSKVRDILKKYEIENV